MARSWQRRSLSTIAIGLVGSWLVACSPTATGFPDFSCTTSIGALPQFELGGDAPVFAVTRPGTGGAAQVQVPIASVAPGAFDFVSWDVLDLIGYAQPPSSMQYVVDQNPTLGTDTTFVRIIVYAETPTGDYGLKIRGLAFTGSFFEGSSEVVGECFARFVLSVN